jgi:hypothetical protein
VLERLKALDPVLRGRLSPEKQAELLDAAADQTIEDMTDHILANWVTDNPD